MIEMDDIKYIRVQIYSKEECHTIIEFKNGTRVCSCGQQRGQL